MSDASKPAFPVHGAAGMTFREYAAVQILAGFGMPDPKSMSAIAKMAEENWATTAQAMAILAVKQADALIAALGVT